MKLCYLLLITLLVSITGCGSPDETAGTGIVLSIPLADYQELESQYNQLVNQLAAQNVEQSYYEDTIKQLRQENLSLINQAFEFRQLYESVASKGNDNGQLVNALTEIVRLKQELATVRHDLDVMSTVYEDATARLVALTPRDFASLEELKEWRWEQKDFGENTIANARKMQKVARDAGYILSVRIGTWDTIAFIGNSIYMVEPFYDIELEDEEDFEYVWKVN